MADFTPYSTAKPWFGVLPTYIPADDADRINAYTTYEQMYWGSEGAFELTQKGTDENPIYVPSGRTIIEATHRYLAVDWDFYVDTNVGTPEEQAAAKSAFFTLFKRENMWSKFNSQKRYCLIRGDALWHIVADEMKEEGKRISIYELDPASYFPIYDEDDIDRLIGCHIVDQIVDANDQEVIRRQTYRKTFDANGMTTGVTSESATYELAGWDDRYGAKPEDIKQVAVLQQPTVLPGIMSLPVYHWRNIRNPADPFGSSQMRGIERLAAAINQTITDQDLAVALTGLGVYTTDSAAPVNDEGEEVNWIIGPGRVIELSTGTTFTRVDGVKTVQPSLDHIGFLQDSMRSGAGVPDIAIGNVEVQAAESGIALSLRLSPLLAQNKEKELDILNVMDNMLYDLLTMWFPNYEKMSFGDVVVSSVVGDPMPTNRQARIDEIVALSTSTPPLITLEEARAELSKLGYSFTQGTADLVTQAGRLAAANDPYAKRLQGEAGDE
jgi:hypothetical protein